MTVSKTYQWAVVPDAASIEQMQDVLREVGFDEDGDNEFVTDLMGWKPFRAKVKKDEILFSFFWPGSKTTSKYYDYLVHSGMMIQKVRQRLSVLPPESDDD